MAIRIEHPDLETVVRDPVVDAILDHMRRQAPRDPRQIEKALREIGERCSKLPVLDHRSPDEILGYDENGLLR
jgi:antitoxin VapB